MNTSLPVHSCDFYVCGQRGMFYGPQGIAVLGEHRWPIADAPDYVIDAINSDTAAAPCWDCEGNRI